MNRLEDPDLPRLWIRGLQADEDRKDAPSEEARSVPVAGLPLSPGEAAALFAGVAEPDPAGEEGGTEEDPGFANLPDRTVAGAPAVPTVPEEATFPAPDPRPRSQDEDSDGPLRVLRATPVGEVRQPPGVCVVFSRPMVPLGDASDFGHEGSPVRLDPPVPGRWRWIGTRSLAFEPAQRFPLATDFHISIPAGTRSLDGARLRRRFTAAFSTPPAQVVDTCGSTRSSSLQPVVVLELDQRVDPAAVASCARWRSGGVEVAATPVPRRDLPEGAAGAMLDHAPDRTIALKPVVELAHDAAWELVVGPGLPSMEGLRVGDATCRVEGRTCGPLRVLGLRDRDNERSISTWCYWHIEFTNDLDPASLDPSSVKVEPDIPEMMVSTSNREIEVRGRPRARSRYRIRLPAGIRDRFGQVLPGAVDVEVRTGPREPRALMLQQYAVLAPGAPRVWPILIRGIERLRIRLFAVGPGDWQAFRRVCRGDRRRLPGRLVLDEVRILDPDSETEYPVDLSPALPGGHGNVIVAVDPVGVRFDRLHEPAGPSWVQATSIALDATATLGRLLVRATALEDGRPMPGVAVSLLKGKATHVTGPDGLADVPLDCPLNRAGVLVGSLGSEAAMLPDDPWASDHCGWRPLEPPRRPQLLWHLLDDRHVYRPGERVHVKGWVRSRARGPESQPRVEPAIRRIAYQVEDKARTELVCGEVEVGSLGGFDFAFDLPAGAAPGVAGILVAPAGRRGRFTDDSCFHRFRVAEFRRPEFEVRVQAPGRCLVRDGCTVEATARYFGGAGLPGAEIDWNVEWGPLRNQYDQNPWRNADRSRIARHSRGSLGDLEDLEGLTDRAGRHRIRLGFDAPPTVPVLAHIEASVTDVNRQAWRGTTSVTLWPASLRPEILPHDRWIRAGEPVVVDLRVLDDGDREVADRPVEVRATRLAWTRDGGDWRRQPAEMVETVVTSGPGPREWCFQPPVAGCWVLRARVRDDAGDAWDVEDTVYAGAVPDDRGARQAEPARVRLLPARAEWFPGDTAEVRVVAAFHPAEGLATLERDGFAWVHSFRMDSPDHLLRIPIPATWGTGGNLRVDLTGAEPGPDGRQPAFGSDSLPLRIRTDRQDLVVAVVPDADGVAPGDEVSVTVDVRTPGGEPAVGAEVALLAVDEAVLAVSGRGFARPAPSFDRLTFWGRPDHTRMRDSLIRFERDSFKMMKEFCLASRSEPVDREGDADAGELPVCVRQHFSPLAAWMPSLCTDPDGRVRARFRLPGNLTRYRVVAIAATGEGFGLGETGLAASLPLAVRPSPPRFLRVGDRFELPVVVQNLADTQRLVKVAARGSGSVLPLAGVRVLVPAGDRLEVRFEGVATHAGRARFQVSASDGGARDAAEMTVPVRATTIRTATAAYGSIGRGTCRVPIVLPWDRAPGSTRIAVDLSGSVLIGLDATVSRLLDYPFDCTEQVASRILALLALRDVLPATGWTGDPAHLDRRLRQDVGLLLGRQGFEGGFGLWRRDGFTLPFVDAHAAEALVAAGEAGLLGDDRVLREARDRIEEHLEELEDAEVVAPTRRAFAAYAARVLSRLEPDGAKRARDQATGWIRSHAPRHWPSIALGWILELIGPDGGPEVRSIVAELRNRAVDNGDRVDFVDPVEPGSWVLPCAGTVTNAVVLSGLLRGSPADGLLVGLVRGLGADWGRERSPTTLEAAFAAPALRRYQDLWALRDTDLSSGMWVGGAWAGEAHVTDHLGAPVRLRFAPPEGDDSPDVTLSGSGRGRLYWRVGVQTVQVGEQPPATRGFVVTRRFDPVDDPADVRRDADGTWHIRAGATIRIRLDLVAHGPRRHVALVGPLPAGMELLDGSHATTVLPPPDRDGPPRPRPRVWLDHHNLRDDRAEGFSSDLPAGAWTWTCLARATTPGTFLAPGPTAEEMYAPETFGRGPVDRVVIGEPATERAVR